MHTIKLANGDELLIADASLYKVSGIGYLCKLENGKWFNDDIDTPYNQIGTLTVHEDRNLEIDFEMPLEDWLNLQSQLPLVNPVDISGQTFSNEHTNRWQEAESKLMKPGKYLCIIKTK